MKYIRLSNFCYIMIVFNFQGILKRGFTGVRKSGKDIRPISEQILKKTSHQGNGITFRLMQTAGYFMNSFCGFITFFNNIVFFHFKNYK